MLADHVADAPRRAARRYVRRARRSRASKSASSTRRSATCRRRRRRAVGARTERHARLLPRPASDRARRSRATAGFAPAISRGRTPTARCSSSGACKELIIRSRLQRLSGRSRGGAERPPRRRAVGRRRPRRSTTATRRSSRSSSLPPVVLPTSASCRASPRRSLAPYKRPSEIRVMTALPASPTGKVLRGQLKTLAATR